MKQVSVYDVIKKQNGEHFAKAIRNYNNGIFDIPDIVNIVKYAGHDAEPIINYLLSLMDIQIKETKYEDPFVLLKKAGYNAYYADTLEKQNAISKYFEKDEKLCTFKDSYRFKNYYIINAVKENVDDIKRENFTNPSREDEYGTSVISIQMLKTGGFISIKNRYNHTVENPDNTFNSNPDNIIKGLSYSLKKHFNVEFTPAKTSLPDNYIIIGDKIIKYDYEINGYYIGDGFYVKNGKIVEVNKNTEIMLDHHILNIKNKTITPIMDDNDNHKDEAKVFQTELIEKKLQIIKNEDKTKSILLDGKEFVTLKASRIIRLTLERASKLPEYFLYSNSDLQYLVCPKVISIADSVLSSNEALNYCYFPELKHIGTKFLKSNISLECLDLPKVEDIDSKFLENNQNLELINLPVIRRVNHNFLLNNLKLKKLNMPKIGYIGDKFLINNNKIKSLNFPKVWHIGSSFLFCNTVLKSINLPSAYKIGMSFLKNNEVLKKINVPELKDTPWTSSHIFSLIHNILRQREEAELLKQTRNNSR
ncbi:leucine-rich repeat protein [bacterium]|nr:leucine-rich repeat protein [bacterium]